MLKEISEPFKNIDAQAMTGTSVITSSVTNIKFKDSVAIQLIWTGTPTGTFAVQGSVDYNPRIPQSQNPVDGSNSGTWVTLTLSPAPAASGSADSALINLNQLAFPWIRVQYTNASGTGTLNGWIAAKSLG